MNILICGKHSGFLRHLADRLNRDRNEIYFLSGNKSEQKLTKNVFQEYHFPYLNEYINNIFSSARPETVIIAGAYDNNFLWTNPEMEATRFVTGMTSLFMAAQGEGVRRLIYLSSTEIYEKNTEENITVDTEPKAQSPRLSALLKTERLLEEFGTQNNDSGMEVIILRLPPVFGDPDGSEVNDFCLRMLWNYRHKGSIPVIPDETHTGIFYYDAVEAVIRSLNTEYSHDNRLFQLKGLVFNEKELADEIMSSGLVKEAYMEIQPEAEMLISKASYPPARIDGLSEETLGIRIKYSLHDAVGIMLKDSMRQERENELNKSKKKGFLPFIEAVAFGYFAYALTGILDGTAVGEGINLFIIYVLAFACTYGISYGLFTAVLGGLGMLILMAQQESFIDVITNYVFYLQFWELMLVGVISGYMKNKLKRRNTQLEEDNKYLNLEVKDLTIINDNNAYVKNVFEKRLIGYSNSLSQVYELTTQLEYYEPQKVVFQAARIVAELMEMSDIAIYTTNTNSQFFRLSAATSKLGISCGKTIHVDEQHFFYEDLMKKTIFMNRECLPNRPTFGSAVYSGDHPIAIIFAWTSDLRQLNLHNSNMLAVACQLIEKSMSRAFLFDNSLRNDNYVSDSNIMNQNALCKMLDVFKDGREQGLLTYAVVRIERKGKSYREGASMVRSSDVVGFIGRELFAILPFVTDAETEIISQRFQKKGMEAVFMAPEELNKYIEERSMEEPPLVLD